MKSIHSSIQVYEYDRLVVSEGFFEKRHLDALLKLNELHQFEYFDAIPNGIRFKQYVGVIQVDDLCIEIYPKIDRVNEGVSWKSVLIQMLKACHKLKASTYGDAHVSRQHLNLLELYFSLFLQELSNLIQKGLIKQYRRESSNVLALKGRIRFADHVRLNIAHQERFFTEHQVYDKDHVLHQVLHAALLVVEEFTRGTHLYDLCKRVQLAFPEVRPIRVTKKLLDSFRFSRKTKPYTQAFEIARLILLNYSPDISSGREKMLALLFDMNKLWEEYVSVKLQAALKNSHYKVTSQGYRPFWKHNFLQPDIVIENTEKEEVIIIDTKWKNPGGLSASVADLRQMYAYNRFWDAEKAVLLYPGQPISSEFESYLCLHDHKKHYCKLVFENVLNEKGTLDCNFGEKLLKQIDVLMHSRSNQG